MSVLAESMVCLHPPVTAPIETRWFIWPGRPIVLLTRVISSHLRVLSLAMPLNSAAISASRGSSRTGRRTLKSPSFRSRIPASRRRRSAALGEPPFPATAASRLASSLPLLPFRFPFLPLPLFRPFFRREPAAVGERVEASSDSSSSTSKLSPISTTLLLEWLLEPARAGLRSRLDPGKARGGGSRVLFKSGTVLETVTDPAFTRPAGSAPRHRRSGRLLQREPGCKLGSTRGGASARFERICPL